MYFHVLMYIQKFRKYIREAFLLWIYLNMYFALYYFQLHTIVVTASLCTPSTILEDDKR